MAAVESTWTNTAFLAANEAIGGIIGDDALPICRSPSHGRIGDRELLGRDWGYAPTPENRIIEDGRLLANGMVSRRTGTAIFLIHGI